MSTAFVPLVARKAGSTAGAGASGAASPAFTPLRAHSPAACAETASPSAREPVVTLQKDGERVIGIRIECGCGQVIELACSY
jgi:hypothetical protein